MFMWFRYTEVALGKVNVISTTIFRGPLKNIDHPDVGSLGCRI